MEGQNYPELIKNICDDIDFTSRIRFSAARRCEFLNNLTNWTVSLISLLLIALPVMQNLAVAPFSSSNNAQNATAIILAVFILIFSQLSTVENYALKAYKYHDCAMKLNQLRRITLPKIPSGDKDSYLELVNNYNDILRDYENHIDADFQAAVWDSIKKSIRKSREKGIQPPSYPKIWFTHTDRIKLLRYRFIFSMRFYAAILISLLMVVWSAYYGNV